MRRLTVLITIIFLILSASVTLADMVPVSPEYWMRQGGTPAPNEILHTVRDGESLYSIAALYGVTVESIAALNNITDFNVVLVGQQLRIPAGGAVATTVPLVEQSAGSTALLTPVPMNAASNVGFAFGVQAFLQGQDVTQVVSSVQDLGTTWVKLRINWADYETTRGQIDFAGMDARVKPFTDMGLNVLLTLASAPAWARSTTVEQGPPIVNQDFANFVGQVAAHYQGEVKAYEIWTEPNVRREWNGKPISPSEYVNLLAVAYNAVKLADPAALVVTAGLAPTAENDGVNAVDDRQFLRGMYAAGAANFSDAVGAQPSGWANPPDSTCCGNNRPAVPAWDDQPAFFFLETLRAYRQIMNDNGDSGAFIWVTGFGWGSSDGIGAPVNPDFGFVTYTDAQEQGQYAVRAFQLGRDLSYVGPMFLSNLNGCVVFGESRTECYWSLLDDTGAPRPIFESVQAATLQ